MTSEYPACLIELSAAAYRLAFRITACEQDAEDAVQQAYMEALPKLRKGAVAPDVSTWFLGVVANAARNIRRTEGRRRRRERLVVNERGPREKPGDNAVRALRAAMEALDSKYRVAIALCYEEGLTQHKAAAVLKMPERTVSKYVQVGLAKLRKALERAGYPAAVAAVLGGLKQTAPTVPASLAGRVEALVAQGAVKTGTGAVASASAAARGSGSPSSG